LCVCIFSRAGRTVDCGFGRVIHNIAHKVHFWKNSNRATR
jgi:hypothetical protein